MVMIRIGRVRMGRDECRKEDTALETNPSPTPHSREGEGDGDGDRGADGEKDGCAPMEAGRSYR